MITIHGNAIANTAYYTLALFSQQKIKICTFLLKSSFVRQVIIISALETGKMLVFSLNKIQYFLPQKAKKTRTPFYAQDRQKLAAGTMSGGVALNTLTLPQSVMRLSISSVPSCGKKRRFNCRSPCQLDSLFVRNCVERFMLLLSL